MDKYNWAKCTRLATVVAIGAAAMAAWGAVDLEQGEPSQLISVSDIGRNALVVSSTYLRVQRLLEQGKTQEARGALDAAQLLQIRWMREYDADLRSDKALSQVRALVVSRLQADWQKTPPEYIDDESASYLQQVCNELPGCTVGRIVGRKTLKDYMRPERDRLRE